MLRCQWVRALIICLLVVTGASLVLGISQLPSADIEIIRDEWGIPHIMAASDEEAMFGLGYVSAQDRLLQMEYSRRVVQGRISEMLGLIGQPGKTTLDSDIKNRHMGTYRHLINVASNLDRDTLQLLQAYCDGVNHYLASEEAHHPLLLQWGIAPEPWQPVDCLAVWSRIATFFSPSWTGEARLLHDYEDLLAAGVSDVDAIQQLSSERVIDEAAAVFQLSDVDPTFIQALSDYANRLGLAASPVPEAYAGEPIPHFSHAWVVGGSRTTSNSAVLVSDPQTSVRNPSVWYEAAVSGKTFTARGIGVAGCPGFLIGWNESVAWGATALGADLSDTFRLDASRSRRNAYVVDGEEFPMSIEQQIIPVRDGRDAVMMVRQTHLGPVVTDLMVHARAGEEYVLRTVEQEYTDRHTVQALFDMMRSRDVASFSEAIAAWTSPGIHSLFGDSSGSIGYWTLAGVPIRSSLSPFGGQASQDGSLSAAGWVDIIPHELLPHVINPSSGVLFSGNHLSVGSWYPLPLGVGTGGSGDSQRSWRLRELLDGESVFTPDDVLAMHFDDVNAAIRSIVGIGYHAEWLGQSLSDAAINTLNTLESWYQDGAHCDSAEPFFAAAYHVARGFRSHQAGELHAIYGGGDGGLCHFLKDLEKRLDENPQLLLSAAELAYIDASLAAGWITAVGKYGSDTSRWQAQFAATTATHALPYGANLEGFPSLDRTLDLASGALSDPEGSTIWSQKGNSYTQWVDLADIDRSLAILPIGISESPESPYYAAEKGLWETGRLRSAPLSLQAIAENADTTQYLSYPTD